MLGNVLLIGRKNCLNTIKLKKFLKKKSKKLFYLESNRLGENISLKKIKNISLDYIFCFRSFYILKKDLIKRCKNAAINFHAGTPKYRGIGSVNFTLYNDEKYCGSTCHIIDEKLDNGKILNVKKFKILNKDNVDSVIKKTHSITLIQAKFIINFLSKGPNNLNKLIKQNKNLKWSKKITKLKDLHNLYIIDKNTSKRDFLRKLRATNSKDFKPSLYLYNKKFVYND